MIRPKAASASGATMSAIQNEPVARVTERATYAPSM